MASKYRSLSLDISSLACKSNNCRYQIEFSPKSTAQFGCWESYRTRNWPRKLKKRGGGGLKIERGTSWRSKNADLETREPSGAKQCRSNWSISCVTSAGRFCCTPPPFAISIFFLLLHYFSEIWNSSAASGSGGRGRHPTTLTMVNWWCWILKPRRIALSKWFDRENFSHKSEVIYQKIFFFKT